MKSRRSFSTTSFGQQRWYEIINNNRNSVETMCDFVLSTVSIDGLALSDDNATSDTMVI